MAWIVLTMTGLLGLGLLLRRDTERTQHQPVPVRVRDRRHPR